MGPWTLACPAGACGRGDAAGPGAALALETQRWTLQDQAARPWLQLRDGLGGVWELENRSAELVPAGQTALPDGSAQFDLPQLEPQLRGELPLVVIVPLASGDAAQLMASPAAVASLHAATTP